MALKKSNIPEHVGIIMDGNGRWAKRRGLPRLAGHKVGVYAIERAIKSAIKMGIKYLTLFAFSTENWKRNDEEIEGIFNLLRDYVSKDLEFFDENNIKVCYIGNLKKFPEDLVSNLENLKVKTQNNSAITVTFALNYGGRDDIVRCVNGLIENGYKNITEELILDNLDTSVMPEPDLIIRTGGEERISNFMIYQMAYSELYFTKTFWPAFNERCFIRAVKNYQKRERRFGGVK